MKKLIFLLLIPFLAFGQIATIAKVDTLRAKSRVVVGSLTSSGDSTFTLIGSGSVSKNLNVVGNIVYKGTVLTAVADIATLSGLNIFTNENEFRRSLSTQFSLGTSVTGDANKRFRVRADGVLEWGSGSASLDVNLYRVTSNVLRTDDDFELKQKITSADGRMILDTDTLDILSISPRLRFNDQDDLNTSGFLYNGSAQKLELDVSGTQVIHFLTTDARMQKPLRLQSWAVATRPSSPLSGYIGFNTDSSKIDLYNGTGWVVVGTGSGGGGASPFQTDATTITQVDTTLLVVIGTDTSDIASYGSGLISQNRLTVVETRANSKFAELAFSGGQPAIVTGRSGTATFPTRLGLLFNNTEMFRFDSTGFLALKNVIGDKVYFFGTSAPNKSFIVAEGTLTAPQMWWNILDDGAHNVSVSAGIRAISSDNDSTYASVFVGADHSVRAQARRSPTGTLNDVFRFWNDSTKFYADGSEKFKLTGTALGLFTTADSALTTTSFHAKENVRLDKNLVFGTVYKFILNADSIALVNIQDAEDDDIVFKYDHLQTRFHFTPDISVARYSFKNAPFDSTYNFSGSANFINNVRIAQRLNLASRAYYTADPTFAAGDSLALATKKYVDAGSFVPAWKVGSDATKDSLLFKQGSNVTLTFTAGASGGADTLSIASSGGGGGGSAGGWSNPGTNVYQTNSTHKVFVRSTDADTTKTAKFNVTGDSDLDYTTVDSLKLGSGTTFVVNSGTTRILIYDVASARWDVPAGILFRGDNITATGVFSGSGASITNLNMNNATSGKLVTGLGGTNVTSSGAAGNYLRSDGANWTSNTIQAGDLPTGIAATKIGSGVVDNTEFGYLDGVTSAIQTQLNNRLQLSGGTLTGSLTIATSFASITLDGTGAQSFNIQDANGTFKINDGSADILTWSAVVWDFTGDRISNIGTPTASSDAATKAYVDTKVSSVTASSPLSSSGGTTPNISFTGVLGETSGGTGESTYTLGDVLYSDATNSLAKLAIGASGTFLRSTGSAPAWSTDGSSLTLLNASNLASGTVADGRLSGNVPLKNAANIFTANQNISTPTPTWTMDNSVDAWALKNATSFQITHLGTGAVYTFGTGGTLTATAFSGSGASLTSLNASNLSSGTLANARLDRGNDLSTMRYRGSVAGSPTGLTDGDLWFNSTASKVSVRINGITYQLTSTVE